MYLKPWKDLYQELHQGEKPDWRSLSDVHAWALKERERLEPLVLEVLRGESSDKAWPDMLFVAQVISTEEIRDVLLERLQEVVAKADGHPLEPMSRDAGVLALSIDLFAKAKDARIVPMVLELIGVEDQGQELVRDCVDALRKLGDKGDSIAALRGIAVGKKHVHMDRRCAMAEKVIQARIRGVDILHDAQEELRTLIETYVRAVEDKDVQAYRKAHIFALQQGLDPEDVEREHFGLEGFSDMIHGVKATVSENVQFDINREELRAQLIVDQRYKFVFLLEVDGWKVAGVTRIAP